MNAANKKIVQAAVKDAGDYLKDKLPQLASHPERNSYAHLWSSIRTKMGCSYAECADCEVEAILAIIAWHKENCV